MKTGDARPNATPPVLAVCLLLAGLACGITSTWLASVDLKSLVERQVIRAHGTVSPETSAWLTNGHFQGGFLVGGVALLALGGLALWQRAALDRFGARLAADGGTGSLTPNFLPSWGVVLATCAAVFLYYFPTLRSGYFRYDDFDMLATAESGGGWDTLWLPNGDHFLPLTRLLAYLSLKLCGVTAWPYNVWILLCLCGVLAAGVFLLAELRVSRAAQLVFVGLVVFWSPWAEIMSGYYILSIFLQITLLGLAAIALYLRWLRRGGKVPIAGLAACFLLAPLIDISGGLVIAASGVFIAANLASNYRTSGPGPWLKKHRRLLGWLAAAGAASLACIVYFYCVRHPGIFLGMAGDGPRSWAQRAGDLGYLFGAGLLGSMVVPFVYARLPIMILAGLIATVSLLWLMFTVTAARAAGPARRWDLAAILTVVLGAGLMVCLGRHNTDTMIVRWAAKHVCPAYVWLCLLLAVSWDTLWQQAENRRRRLGAELTLIGLGLFVVAQNAFGLVGMAVAFPPFGYPAEIRDAGRRRAAVEGLRQDLVGRIAARFPAGVTIPTLDGNSIQARYPSLFTYNLSRYRPFFADLAGPVKFVRNAAMQPWPADGVQTVPVLRDAVSPAFLQMLEDDPVVRAYYFASASLEARPGTAAILPNVAAGTDAGFTVDSNGTTELPLRIPAWDPETAPRLRLAAQIPDGPGPREIPVTVLFWSERLNADWHGTLLLRGQPGEVTEVDLRQAYAFALSGKVANLRLVLTSPGRYRFRLAEVIP